MPAGVNPAGQFSPVAILDFGNGITVPIPALGGILVEHYKKSMSYTGEVLVFLNACQSAGSGPVAGGLLDHLFTVGFKHIIGSETLIPDRLAGYFAEKVYDGLLAAQTLGMAVYRARRTLVEEHGNPGGVLWSVYGDPDLRLRPT